MKIVNPAWKLPSLSLITANASQNKNRQQLNSFFDLFSLQKYIDSLQFQHDVWWYIYRTTTTFDVFFVHILLHLFEVTIYSTKNHFSLDLSIVWCIWSGKKHRFSYSPMKSSNSFITSRSPISWKKTLILRKSFYELPHCRQEEGPRSSGPKDHCATHPELKYKGDIII